jgi:hypothetical protein
MIITMLMPVQQWEHSGNLSTSFITSPIFLFGELRRNHASSAKETSCVRYRLTECSLKMWIDPQMYPESWLNVPWKLIKCSLNVRINLQMVTNAKCNKECPTDRAFTTECSLNVHWNLTECSLKAHWTFPESWLNVPWMCELTCRWWRMQSATRSVRLIRRPPLNVHWKFTECSLKADWTFPESWLNVPWMCESTCRWWRMQSATRSVRLIGRPPLNVHWMFTESSLNVHWKLTERSLKVDWMFPECANWPAGGDGCKVQQGVSDRSGRHHGSDGYHSSGACVGTSVAFASLVNISKNNHKHAYAG